MEPSAGSLLVGTIELLEIILQHLDMKTLLLAQRVNRTWHDVISTNTYLQKKLFMVPSTLDEAIVFAKADSGTNKLVINRDGIVRKSAEDRLLLKHTVREDCFIRNPLVTFKCRQDHIRIDAPQLLKIAEHLQPSWTRMLYTQPPIGRVRGSICVGQDLRASRVGLVGGCIRIFGDFVGNEPMKTLSQLVEAIEKKIGMRYEEKVDWRKSSISLDLYT